MAEIVHVSGPLRLEGVRFRSFSLFEWECSTKLIDETRSLWHCAVHHVHCRASGEVPHRAWVHSYHRSRTQGVLQVRFGPTSPVLSTGPQFSMIAGICARRGSFLFFLTSVGVYKFRAISCFINDVPSVLEGAQCWPCLHRSPRFRVRKGPDTVAPQSVGAVRIVTYPEFDLIGTDSPQRSGSQSLNTVVPRAASSVLGDVCTVLD